MSKRAIVPIVIKNRDLVIHNQNELFELFKNNRDVYNALFLSGDAGRMSFAYSRMLPCIHQKDKTHKCETFLPFGEDPFSQETRVDLNALAYFPFNNTIYNNLEIIGMHRHKTLLNGEKRDSFVVESELSISHVLLKEFTIIIRDKGLLRLSSLTTDSVHITIENGGILELMDVEFSNNLHESVFIKEGGVVALYENVRYFDVHKRFKIELASMDRVGLVLDLRDAFKIIDFLETSIVEKIELLGDINLFSTEVILKQPVEFINPSSDEIEVTIKSIETANNLKFTGKFQTKIDLIVNNADSIFISLGRQSGKLTIEESDSIEVYNTTVQERSSQDINDKIIDIVSSSVSFKNSHFLNTKRPIYKSDSSVKFYDCNVFDTFELCTLYETDIQEDDLFIKNEKKKTFIGFYGGKIERSIFLRTKTLNSFFMQGTDVSNNKLCMEIENCDDVKFEILNVKRNDIFVKFVKSIAIVDNCDIQHGDSAFEIHHSSVELNKTVVKNFTIGAHINSGVLRTRDSVISSNEFGVILEGEGCLLEHYDCDFSDNKQRRILQKPGSTLVDLKEQEELEKCHVL